MGLIEGCKMFLETVGLTMWQMGLNLCVKSTVFKWLEGWRTFIIECTFGGIATLMTTLIYSQYMKLKFTTVITLVLSNVILYSEVQNQNYLTHPHLLNKKLRECPDKETWHQLSKFWTLDSWLNFDFRVSGTRLSRLLDSNLTKVFYPSLRCQVSYPIKSCELWPLISI